METNGVGNDPGGWWHVILGGLLVGVGQRIWELLRGEKRPEGGEHSDSYLAEQVKLIRESQDRMEATLDDLGQRVTRLESLPRRATAGD